MSPLILRGITWEHPRGFDSVAWASHAYSVMRQDVSIQWSMRSLTAFGDAPLAELAAEFDLLVIDHPHVPAAAEEGLLLPLDLALPDAPARVEVLAGLSVGRSHASYQFDGHQYGLASDAACQVSVYRPDLLAEPPADWDAVLRLAKEGRVRWPAKPVDAYSSLISIAGAHGFVPLGQPGEFLADDEMEPILAIMHQLADRVPPEDLTANPIQVLEAMASSDSWSYCPLAYGYNNYSRPGFRRTSLRVGDVPRGPVGSAGAILGGAGIAVSARSRQPEVAADFAFWVASAGTQTGPYFEAGGQPGNAAAWHDPRLDAAADGFFRRTHGTMSNAYLRPQAPEYVDFQNMAAPLVTLMLLREIDDRTLVRRLNAAARSLSVVADSAGPLGGR